MTIERTLTIDGIEYPLTLSDERETLLTAKAAGRVVVGLGRKVKTSDEEDPGEWLPVDFVTETFPADEDWLEGAARRQLGIPWKIAETERLIIREFSVYDCAHIPDDADDSPDEAILKDPQRLHTYINEQYAFFDCGMWALTRKEDGRIVGMVSLTPSQSLSDSDNERKICELGYHVYTPYRHMGYAKEACGKLLELLKARDTYTIAYTDTRNVASVALLEGLGFKQISDNCFLYRDFV